MVGEKTETYTTDWRLPPPPTIPDFAVPLTVMMNVSILAVARANVALVAIARCPTKRICPACTPVSFPCRLLTSLTPHLHQAQEQGGA